MELYNVYVDGMKVNERPLDDLASYCLMQDFEDGVSKIERRPLND